jgi:nucleoid-associated protein YgaU/DNA-binding SARP family transcriptional activator
MVPVTRVARALMAVVVLAALMIGVPLALAIFVGWPLPTSVPSLTSVEHALSAREVSDTVVVKSLAVVVWIAWTQLAVAVVVEVVALFRGRAPKPTLVAGPMRRAAASLVASIAVVSGTFGVKPLPMPAIVAAVAPWGTGVAAAAAPRAAAPSTAERASVPTQAAPAPSSVTVVGRDTLWSIAERELGTGERWPEIVALNVGREVAPGVLFSATTEHLEAGWRLQVPNDGRDVAHVVPGDCLSTIAQREYGDAQQWPRLWEANRGRQFGDRTFGDPNLVYAGWELDVPPLEVPAAGPGASRASEAPAPAVVDHTESGPVHPEVDSTSQSSTVPPSDPPELEAAAAPSADAVTAPASSIDGRGSDDVALEAPEHESAMVDEPSITSTSGRTAVPAWVEPMGLSGAGLLATGVAGLIASKRRRALRSTGRDEWLVPLDESLSRVHALVDACSEPVAAARLDVALRALARELRSAGRARVAFVIQRRDGTIEVQGRDLPAACPLPWTPLAGGWWGLAPVVPLEDLAVAGAGASSPCPALIELGTTEDGARVFVDLEAVGITRVEGDREMARALARAALTSLALSPLADVVNVVVSGLEPSELHPVDRVAHVEDGDAVLETLASSSSGVRAAVADEASTFVLRGGQRDEPWEPSVGVLVGDELSRPLQEHAASLVADGGRGVALLTDAAIEGVACVLSVQGDRMLVEPLGLRIRPACLAADELEALVALSEAIEVPPRTVPRGSRPEEPFAETAWQLLVRVLGPVDVVDEHQTPVDFERSKALELVVWLALHRDHPSRVAARTALWESDVRDATFANVVSDARRSMARRVTPPEGEEWIGRTHGERLPIHRQVRTDAELLRARLEYARCVDDVDAAEVLRPGVEMLRGQPMGATAYLWSDSEAVTSGFVVLATSAAAELASRYLELGDVDSAFWSTAQGLRVLPGHEELVCLRMEAHARRGDISGVRLEYESYERVVLSDPWGDGTPASKVVAARNRLGRPVPIPA